VPGDLCAPATIAVDATECMGYTTFSAVRVILDTGYPIPTYGLFSIHNPQIISPTLRFSVF